MSAGPDSSILAGAPDSDDVDSLLACPSCDQLFDVGHLDDGETARCERCGHFLTEYRADGISRVLSYAIASIVLLLIACSYPFMSFKAKGLESTMTLPQTALELYLQGMPGLALIVAAFIILIPTTILFLVLAVAVSLLRQRTSPWLVPAARTIFTLQNWSMVEVFLIGVIVSLVKIMKMATLVMGISFWAYAAFAVCFTLTLAGLDRFQCWRHIEELQKP